MGNNSGSVSTSRLAWKISIALAAEPKYLAANSPKVSPSTILWTSGPSAGRATVGIMSNGMPQRAVFAEEYTG
jgi:hypothetical protein